MYIEINDIILTLYPFYLFSIARHQRLIHEYTNTLTEDCHITFILHFNFSCSACDITQPAVTALNCLLLGIP